MGTRIEEKIMDLQEVMSGELNELDKELDDLGSEDLTLGIFCTKCNAQFELNTATIAMAFLREVSLLTYLKYVQNSKCPVCSKEKEEGGVEKL